jgi:molecular chaperone DnaK
MPETRRTPTLAQCLARASGREFERRLQTARYYAGIDLGTTHSSVTLVDAVALLRGDTDEAVRVLPVRQHTSRGVRESPLLPSIVAEVEPGEWWVGLGAREARSRGLLRGRQIFYSTKLEMGLGRDPFYPQASSREYDSPYKVAGRILDELRGTLEDEAGPEAAERVVVTVPASFQLAARKDTRRAAALAGIDLQEQALLDEPNAAFLDCILAGRPQTEQGVRLDLTSPRNVLVFDFGGGTCDVSVLRVHADGDTQRLDLANLSIARYEQLGGDNIDAAIVEQVLLPQLLEQNGLESLDLTFTEKRERILPQLLSTAEALKLRACGEDDAEVPRSIQIDLPPRPKTPLRTLTLNRPSLTGDQFQEVLEPFLETDFLYPRGSELNRVSSVFGPIRNALQGAGLDEGDIDAILPVGGSALIPQVEEALSGYFERATLLRYPDKTRALTAVTRGAALQSFFAHAFGRPLINPIAQESLGVLTQEGGFVELVPRGTELPFPKNGEPATHRGLVVPRDMMKDLQIVVAAGGPDKPLGVEHLQIPLVRSGGEPIDLSFRLDANKILTVNAELTNHPDVHCMVLLENPLCAVAYGSARQREIAELEDQVARATARDNPAIVSDRMERLASLYAEDNQHERAIDQARKAMERDQCPSLQMLNRMANSYRALGAHDRAEKHYREALRVAPSSSTVRFNLSLLLANRGRTAEALEVVTEAIELAPTEPVYRGWRGILNMREGAEADGRRDLVQAAADLDKRRSLDPWERGWRGDIARALGDTATATRLENYVEPAESVELDYDESCLPSHTGTLARRAS